MCCAGRKQYDRARRAALQALKAHPCVDCGGTFHTAAMQWDHRPDEVKAFEIGPSSSRSMALLLAEMEKCDLVCANCHAVRTFERRRNATETSS